MEKKVVQTTSMAKQEKQAVPGPASPGEREWQEPKLVFIEPKLVSHGKLENLTTGFFGGLTP